MSSIALAIGQLLLPLVLVDCFGLWSSSSVYLIELLHNDQVTF